MDRQPDSVDSRTAATVAPDSSVDIFGLERAVADACDEIDRLRVANAALLVAARSALRCVKALHENWPEHEGMLATLDGWAGRDLSLAIAKAEDHL